MGIKHTFTSNKSDGDDTSLVRPSNWNAEHTLTKQHANYDPRSYPSSPNSTYDDEFDDTTGMSGTNNGLNARWNWRNQGGASVSFTKAGYLTLNLSATSSSENRILEIASFDDGTYEAYIGIEGTLGNYNGGGIVLVDGTNGDFYLFALIWADTTRSIYIQSWTNVTTWSSNPAVATLPRTSVYLKVTKSGSTLGFWFSDDGIAWNRLYTATDAISATRIGLGAYESNNTGLTKLHVDYFRKTA